MIWTNKNKSKTSKQTRQTESKKTFKWPETKKIKIQKTRAKTARMPNNLNNQKATKPRKYRYDF